MRNSCCVSMLGLLKSRCSVRSDTPMRSISHSFVCFWRRSSARIRLPMCICIVVAICALGYRFLVCFPRPQKKEASLSRLPVCGRGNYLSKERPKCPPRGEHLHLSSLEPCLKFSTFQTGSEQIANAMLLNM